MVNNFGANILFVIGHGSRYIIQVDDFYKEVFCNEKHCSLIKGTREYTNQAFWGLIEIYIIEYLFRGV